MDFSLVVGASADSITVTSATPTLQTHSVDTGQVIETREILDLPLVDRNFLDLAFLTAGVIHGPGGNSDNLSVNGQREFANSDRAERDRDHQQQKQRLGNKAERGRTARIQGGHIRVRGGVRQSGGRRGDLQTKPGTNEFHGDAYFFYRPKQTAAQDFFSLTPSNLHHDNFGGDDWRPYQAGQDILFRVLRRKPAGKQRFLSEFHASDKPDIVSSGRFRGPFEAGGPRNGNQIPIFDPYFYSQNFYSQQFAGNIIPANMVSAAEERFCKDFFPKPQFAGTSNGWYNNSIYNSAYSYHGRQRGRAGGPEFFRERPFIRRNIT